ncbi:hypothetical protein P5V15_005433 [Pogonomyrmex californicus]
MVSIVLSINNERKGGRDREFRKGTVQSEIYELLASNTCIRKLLLLGIDKPNESLGDLLFILIYTLDLSGEKINNAILLNNASNDSSLYSFLYALICLISRYYRDCMKNSKVLLVIILPAAKRFFRNTFRNLL